jgi:beta-lactamase regulating signal transducer with metallopeptidase domain
MISPALLPSQPWVERLGWTLLHFLWQGVLIARLFALTRALGGRACSAQTRYVLACAALLAMAIAPVVTFSLIGSGSTLIPANASAWSARPFAAADSQVAIGAWHMPLPAISQQALPWIVTAWLGGALLFCVRLAGGWALAARMRSAGSSRPAPPEWQRQLDELILRVGVSRPVRLLVSSLAQAPLVIGFLRPAILMPVGALAGLPVEQIEALLAHELAHIRRHDYLVNLLQSVAEALLFYHPSVWWLSNEIRAERELCCDDVAVAVSGDVLTYARALTAVESQRPARLRTAMAANGGSLSCRIRRLLDPSQAMAQTQPGPGTAAALGILLIAGIGAAAMNRNAVTVQVLPAPRAEIPVGVAYQAQPLRETPPVTRRGRTLMLRPGASALLAPKALEAEAHVQVQVKEKEPEQASESIQRGVREGEARNRFGNFEVRTWGTVEGEPVLRRIEFRGMTEEFAREVLARLPVQEGQRISHATREVMGRTFSQYGRRLEFGLASDNDGGAVLRIHPPGEAGAPLLQRERRQ